MPRASLTRRGRIVLGICLAAGAMAVVVGGRSLNAIVLPGAVALAAGYLQVSRVDAPGVRRSGLADGFVGEEHEIRLDFHGDEPGATIERGFIADVRDRLDGGLYWVAGRDGSAETVRTAVGDEPAMYRVRYRDRGEARFGPVEVAATDVFGLFTRPLLVDQQDQVVVYPEVRAIPAWFRRGLYAADALGSSQQREEFDRLREYARGDALRDIHWPATAKHDELVVKEFAAETEHRRVSIAAETEHPGDASGADVLASATASLGLSLLNDGVPVTVALPTGTVEAEPGPHGRRELLELAAHAGAGSVADPDDADVHVVAEGDDARIHAEELTVAFTEFDTAVTAATRREDDRQTDPGAPGPNRRRAGGAPGGAAVGDGGQPR